MYRIAMSFLAAALVAVCWAGAEDDDFVMGVWEGKFTTAGWESKTVSAKIWGIKKGAWDGKITISEGGKAIADGTIADHVTDKSVSFQGSINVGTDYIISGDVVNEKFTGTLSAGKVSKKGKIKASKKGGAAISFEMQRQHIKPPSLGAPAPDGAVVLLGAKNLDAWTAEKWSMREDGTMVVTDFSEKTVQEFGSCKLHVEFMTPYVPTAGVGSQERGNSGVYVQGRYEVQVLDSFAVKPENNLCGGIYKIATPIAEAALPPLTWQTYDIEFHAPKFDAAGKKTQDAELTVVQNGITIHDHLKLPHATPGGISEEEGPKGPLLLQNHHNAVAYGNIWIQPLQD